MGRTFHAYNGAVRNGLRLRHRRRAIGTARDGSGANPDRPKPDHLPSCRWPDRGRTVARSPENGRCTVADRGIVYIVWGEKVLPILDRSRISVANIHPELPVHVEVLPPDSTLLDKSRMHRLTPFEETLFLDSDTVVMDRLDFGFDMAAQHGLAVSICECPWARRYGGIRGDTVEYNTGVIFFNQKSYHVFDAWDACGRDVDSSILFYQGTSVVRMPYNDQAEIGRANADTEIGRAHV